MQLKYVAGVKLLRRQGENTRKPAKYRLGKATVGQQSAIRPCPIPWAEHVLVHPESAFGKPAICPPTPRGTVSSSSRNGAAVGRWHMAPLNVLRPPCATGSPPVPQNMPELSTEAPGETHPLWLQGCAAV